MSMIHSAGAVLYTVEDGQRKYVLVREKNGSYGLPKGMWSPAKPWRKPPCAKCGKKPA